MKNKQFDVAVNRENSKHTIFVVLLISSYFFLGAMSFFDRAITQSPVLTGMFLLFAIMMVGVVLYFIRTAMKNGRGAVIGFLSFYLLFIVIKAITYLVP